MTNGNQCYPLVRKNVNKQQKQYTERTRGKYTKIYAISSTIIPYETSFSLYDNFMKRNVNITTKCKYYKRNL